MLKIKARLSDIDPSFDGQTPFHVVELSTADGEDLTALVSATEPFRSVEELNAYLTLRLARETETEIVERETIRPVLSDRRAAFRPNPARRGDDASRPAPLE